MLPIRGYEAIVGGFLISTSHIFLLTYLHRMNTASMVSVEIDFCRWIAIVSDRKQLNVDFQCEN